MALISLDRYSKQTGIVGKPISDNPIVDPVLGKESGIRLVHQDHPVDPLDTDIVLRSTKGDLRTSFRRAVLDPHSAAVARVTDPWKLVHELSIPTFSRDAMHDWLHKHLTDITVISSALTNAGANPTMVATHTTQMQAFVAGVNEIRRESMFLDRLESQRVIVEQCLADRDQYSNTVHDDILLPTLTLAEAFNVRSAHPDFWKTYLSAMRRDALVQNWGPDEVLICDDAATLHGPCIVNGMAHGTIRTIDL